MSCKDTTSKLSGSSNNPFKLCLNSSYLLQACASELVIYLYHTADKMCSTLTSNTAAKLWNIGTCIWTCKILRKNFCKNLQKSAYGTCKLVWRYVFAMFLQKIRIVKIFRCCNIAATKNSVTCKRPVQFFAIKLRKKVGRLFRALTNLFFARTAADSCKVLRKAWY